MKAPGAGPALAAGLAVLAGLAGCGFDVQSADLFVLTRSGQGKALTMLVNDGGTIRCDGGKAKPLSDPLLLQARDLATNLDDGARSKLHIAPPPDSVFSYTIMLQDGTISFPDTAAAKHHELAPAELFAAQAAQQACGLSG